MRGRKNALTPHRNANRLSVITIVPPALVLALAFVHPLDVLLFETISPFAYSCSNTLQKSVEAGFRLKRGNKVCPQFSTAFHRVFGA